MSVRDCEIFLSLLETKNTSATAKKFNLSQPAVTKILNIIESHVGSNLFYKSKIARKRSFELTESGIAFKRFAQEMVENHARLVNDLQKLETKKYSQLRIALPPIGAALVVPYLTKFQKHYPHVKISLIEDSAESIENKILAHEIDIGFLPYKLDAIDTQRKLLELDIHILFSAQHYQAPQLNILNNKTLILLKDAERFNHMVLETLTDKGITPNFIYKTTQLDFILQMVESGSAFTILPQQYTLTRNKNLASIPLTPLLKWQLIMTWLDTNPNAMVLKWIDFLNEGQKYHPYK